MEEYSIAAQVLYLKELGIIISLKPLSDQLC